MPRRRSRSPRSTASSRPADLVKDTIDNGAMQVPTAKLDATLIHLEEGKDPGDAVQQAVDLGMFTWEQICTGPGGGDRDLQDQEVGT